MQAFPTVILALTLLALLGSSLTSVIVVIAVAFAPNYARVTRALVLTTKQDQFVEAARSLGAGQLAHRRRPHPAEHHRAALHPARHGPARRDHARGGPLVPRPRCAAADAFLGSHPRRTASSESGSIAVADPLGGPDADDRRRSASRSSARRCATSSTRGSRASRRWRQAVTRAPCSRSRASRSATTSASGALQALSDVSFRRGARRDPGRRRASPAAGSRRSHRRSFGCCRPTGRSRRDA